ncbi:hypothetical protein Ae201684P_014451 [Aphanomyces euteiches]|nr:hypothetical protein Ae201684P_014451 [Aphanomyces euteiches]KAH9154606.1 hypothetical protein AeRB84_003324 [Aphanomyces euteiches]
MEGYLRFRQKCKEWQQVHETLLRLLSSFQSQVESMRSKLGSLAQPSLNQPIDPLWIEDLFVSIQDTLPALEAILKDMYIIYEDTMREETKPLAKALCSRRDYIGFVGVELEMYEAEYQHTEVLVKNLRFDTPSNIWNTSITSLSTQPFLDLDVITDITEVFRSTERCHL